MENKTTKSERDISIEKIIKALDGWEYNDAKRVLEESILIIGQYAIVSATFETLPLKD